LKTLRKKHVRFVESFSPSGGRNTSQGGSAKEFASGLQTFTDVYRQLQKLTDDRKVYKDPQRPVRICKELQMPVRCLQKPVKRIGAIQVFCPRPTKLVDLGIGGYRMSRVVDDFTFTQDLYFGRNRTFRVATAYKTKANKVRPVDPGETDGSKPGGSLDWFGKSKADDVPCLDPRKYAD
jgi:hypothetical protein